MKIDWASEETLILANPRLPEEEIKQVYECIQNQRPYKGHIWISTSGTTSTHKWAALSKQAILCSAESVNLHLQSTTNDIWVNPLPGFHVGGLGIWARAYLTGAECISFQGKWDPQGFYELLKSSNCTLTAIVPAQLHDLIVAGYSSPKSLRGVVVGGGRLTEELYLQAQTLGWPVLPSYGLTECCSQVATAEMGSRSPQMKNLSHVEIQINEEGLIELKSPSLLSAYAIITAQGMTLEDPKKKGWFTTSDRGLLGDGFLEVLGRKDDNVKIGGENVDFSHLEKILDTIKGSKEFALVSVPDERLGTMVHLCAIDPEGTQQIVDEFNLKVMPYERIRQVHFFKSLPKTDLGKVKKMELLKHILKC